MQFPFEDRYHRYNRYLKDTFGEKVYRISLDAGFTCPTRDGTLGTDGCLYCNNASFAPQKRDTPPPSIETQLQLAMPHLREKRKVKKVLAYFQAYTNTYAGVEHLRELYNKALQFPGVVGICIGTRPDCVGQTVLNLLQELNRDHYVSVELGIESVYDKTLQWVNRGHDFQQTRRAIQQCHQVGLHVSGHYILGFPTESRSEMIAAPHLLNALPLDAIKIHHLHIVKNTPLASLYHQSPFDLFSTREWITLVCDFLERLRGDIVIQRLVGDARGDTLIAPRWKLSKMQIINAIIAELAQRHSYQGKLAT